MFKDVDEASWFMGEAAVDPERSKFLKIKKTEVGDLFATVPRVTSGLCFFLKKICFNVFSQVLLRILAPGKSSGSGKPLQKFRTALWCTY